MMHLALYSSSIANGAVLRQITNVADPVIATSGLGFLVNSQVPNLLRIAAVGTNLTRTQLASGTIRKYTPFDINPVNVGTAMESPARVLYFDNNPFALKIDEELDAFGVQSNAGAQQITMGVLMSDGPIRPANGTIFSVHWTAAVTLAVLGFTGFQPVFDNGLPSGTFALVGLRAISAGALFARVIPRGGNSPRPGVPCFQAQDGYDVLRWRYGEMGELLRFTNTTPPQIEMFSISADTSEEGYMDLIQVG